VLLLSPLKGGRRNGSSSEGVCELASAVRCRLVSGLLALCARRLVFPPASPRSAVPPEGRTEELVRYDVSSRDRWEPLTNTRLEALGWNSQWESKFSQANLDGIPARVVRHDAVKVLVATGDSVEHVTFSRSTPLAVGDWVVITNETVAGMLERDNELVRDTGDYGTQVIGANIDVVVVVFGADRPLKQRKVMRFVAFAGDIGARPILIVSKTDVLDDPESVRTTLREWLPGVEVLLTSATHEVGISAVFDALAGRTATFLGESGVGKSSLVNALMKDEVAWISDVRETDKKGRHTTTHRELHRLPGGGLVIDNPGIRALGLHAEGEGVEALFSDVEALAPDCRFRDCAHRTEPGCAVRAAIEKGDLSEDRWSGYLSFVEEQAAAAERTELRTRAAASRSEATSVQKARDADDETT